MKISRGRVVKPEKIIIYGPEGIGKTTIASKFPDALFIDTEESSGHLDVARFDKPESLAMLLSQIKYVYDNPDVCKTLIIDTLDWAETLTKENIISKNKWSSISEPDYGRGYTVLEEEVGNIFNTLNEVNEKGITIVALAHAKTSKVELPEQLGQYDKWELKLEKKVAAKAKEWADTIIFANYETFISNKNKRGKGKGTGGKRVMHLEHRATWDAKNRWGLSEEKYPLDYEIIKPFVEEYLGNNETDKKAKETFELLKDGEVTPFEMKSTEEIEKEEKNLPFAKQYGNKGFEKVKPELQQLMEKDNITLSMIMNAVELRGYFPSGTKYEALPEDFIDGVLIGAWESIKEFIFENIDKDKVRF